MQYKLVKSVVTQIKPASFSEKTLVLFARFILKA